MSAAGNVNQSQRHDSKTPPRDFRVASQTFQYPPLKPLPTPLSISKNPPKSPCGHMNSGQELCYLCHQRQTRNIPVDFSEERKRREREEEMLLSQYQEMKNTEAFLKQQVCHSKARHVCCEFYCHFCVTFQEEKLAKRHEQQKMDAFNMGVADAISLKHRVRDVNFHPSYLFQKRPRTPPRFLKQQEYAGDLKDQVYLVLPSVIATAYCIVL